MLPSIIDYDKDDYTVTATLSKNGSELPDWIQFDSRKFIISPPQGTPQGNDFNVNIKITDSVGLFTQYTLYILILNQPIYLKLISNITLTSPQNYSFAYQEILGNPDNYDLNNTIYLKNVNGDLLPYWITENRSEYNSNISTLFNPSKDINLNLYFQVSDYCGNVLNTNNFCVTILPNSPASIINRPDNATFYKGQQVGIITTPNEMFSDPGDTIKIYTTLCIENESQLVRTNYSQSNNHILVTYPMGFTGICTLAVVARDSIDNISLILYRITISECGQSACSKCTSYKISDCQQCEANHILNLKNGDCVSILSIYSLLSIRIIGMFMFFFLFLHFLIQTICKLFSSENLEIDLMMSIIGMIQTILLVSNFNMEVSDMWRSFIDGFQYFKFNFRFLNIIFYIQSSVESHDKAIPSRMYYLFFEIFMILLALKMIKYFIIRSIKKRLKRTDSTEEAFQVSMTNKL